MFSKLIKYFCSWDILFWVSIVGVSLSLLNDNESGIVFHSVWMCTSIIMLKLNKIEKGDK